MNCKEKFVSKKERLKHIRDIPECQDQPGISVCDLRVSVKQLVKNLQKAERTMKILEEESSKSMWNKARAEGYFTAFEFYGPHRPEYLHITYEDGAWQAMKILGDKNMPRGMVSFRTKKIDLEANISDFMNAEVQVRWEKRDKIGFSWDENAALRYDETSDSWILYRRGFSFAFERCNKIEAIQATVQPDWP